VAGGTAGVLAEVLVLRLNPEVTQTPQAILISAPLWASWGAAAAGIPLLAMLALVRQIRRRKGGWPAPQLTALVYIIAAVMCRVNSDLHAEFLSPSCHRYLNQDAVAWTVAALLALISGAVVTRTSLSTRSRIIFAVVMLLLPVVRLVWQPTPPLAPIEVVARPLGAPDRPLVVIGVEGLDSKVLLTHVEEGRHETLARLRRSAAWGPVRPHRPHLRQSLWTTVATGTFPGRHGVKSHWGWKLPLMPGQVLRLLPWTPQGSRMILPWDLGRRVVPPPSSVAPLWERLRASRVPSEVIGWPGIWEPGVLDEDPPQAGTATLNPDIARSLASALADFGERGDEVWAAVTRDSRIIDAAVEGLRSGVGNLWIHLEALSEARRELEPIKRIHTREREVLELTIELLDDHLERVLEVTPEGGLVALVSPYGLKPPGSWERLRRLLGIGGDWRASAEENPAGLLMLIGDGVAEGSRFREVETIDIAPTLCYLLGLPLAQYMEGGVILEAVDEGYLADHPLRVID